MKVLTIDVGPLETNCYVAYDEDTKEAIVIDPGDDGDRILKLIRTHELKVKHVVNTHGHYDHVGADLFVSSRYMAPVHIHQADRPMAFPQMSRYRDEDLSDIDHHFELLDEGDVVEAGSIRLKVLNTPGHTEGCICLYTEGHLFTGDLLFEGAIGRTDLPGGSLPTMMRSLRKVAELPDDTIVYPGHGPATTIGREKAENPYIGGV